MEPTEVERHRQAVQREDEAGDSSILPLAAIGRKRWHGEAICSSEHLQHRYHRVRQTLFQCLLRRSCLRISDTMTPWIFNSRAGINFGYRGFSAFRYGRPCSTT